MISYHGRHYSFKIHAVKCMYGMYVIQLTPVGLFSGRLYQVLRLLLDFSSLSGFILPTLSKSRASHHFTITDVYLKRPCTFI